MKRLILVFIIALTLGAFASCGECEHQWEEASCEKAKECSLCGETSGSPLEHSWISASCESAENALPAANQTAPPLDIAGLRRAVMHRNPAEFVIKQRAKSYRIAGRMQNVRLPPFVQPVAK